jgi:transposase
MARALSQDLRSRVIAAVEGGMSRRGAAARFGVGIATAIRWWRDWRTEGRATARPMGGDLRSHRVEAFAAVILGAIEAKVDITLVELAELLAREHGARFAPSTIWRFLDRHDMTLKKSRARQRAATSRRGPATAGLVRRAA